MLYPPDARPSLLPGRHSFPRRPGGCWYILDPNRNVDPAFHSTLLARRDGRVISGRERREQGPTLIRHERNGKETPIRSADVDERKLTRLSPMPADFGVVIAEGDLYDLVAFLLAQAGAAAAPGDGLVRAR